MAKVVSSKRVASACVLSLSASLSALLATSTASAADGPRSGRSTTEAQEEAQKEQTGVRNLGTSGLEDPNDPTLQVVKAERRSSFVVGLSLGAAIGSAAGFPNDPTKIGLVRYYTETDVGAGFSGRLWTGVALRDFLVFGLTVSALGVSAGDKVFFGGTLGFHTEIYPAFGLGGRFRDLGISVETGVGTGIVRPASDANTILVDGGFASAVGIGAFYEGFRFGSKLGMGPYLSYDYLYNSSLRGGAFVLGWRTALYPMHR